MSLERQRFAEKHESWESSSDLGGITSEFKSAIADLVWEKYGVELGEEEISNVEKSLEDEGEAIDADNLHRNLEAVALTKALEEEQEEEN